MFERSLTLLTLLLACNASEGQEFGATAGTTQLVGNRSRLSAAELAAYTADGQYVRGLASPRKAIHINFADPRQYTFAISRLKIAGKTPANSPHLFELIEDHRQAQTAQGLRAGAVASPADDPPVDPSEVPQADHYFQQNALLDTTVRSALRHLAQRGWAACAG